MGKYSDFNLTNNMLKYKITERVRNLVTQVMEIFGH